MEFDTTMDGIRLIKPAPELRTCVRFYAQRNVRIYDAVMIHPLTARAAPLIEFLFGDRFEVSYNASRLTRTTPRSVVVGPQTHFRGQLRLRGTVDSFVIMFQPTGLYRLFSIPMHQLTDRDYEAHSVLGAFVSHLEQRLRECRTVGERVSITDQLLLRRSLNALAFDRISSVASRILLCDGNVGIAALADETGLSVRQLERGFIQQVGMRPKLYARIARFEAALDSKVRLSGKSWTDVAHEFDYCDQMHMIHDFEDFTGQTPTKTLRQTEMLFRGQIEAMRSYGLSANTSDAPRIVL